MARRRSLRRADNLSSGVLPSVVRLGVIEGTHRGGLGPIGLSILEKKGTVTRMICLVSR